MNEHGILFKPEMIKAIIEGRKTQTRRIIKPQPDDKGFYQHKAGHVVHQKDLHLCAKYQPGDFLYIKEGISYVLDYDDKACEHRKKLCYKIDNKDSTCDIIGRKIKWKSPLFMPKIAARTWLKVRSVRVERIQDINEADSISEGVNPNCISAKWDGVKYYVPQSEKCNQNINCNGCGLSEWNNYLGCEDSYPCYTAKESFQTLWDSINKKPKPLYIGGKIKYYTSYPWEKSLEQVYSHRKKELKVFFNPWVYVYDFEVVKHAL